MAVVTQYFLPESAQFKATVFPAITRRDGTNFPVMSLAYDTSTVERAYWHFNAINYASGNITCTIYWYPDTATTNGVVWETAIACITPNTDTTTNVETKSLATVNTAADTNLGNTKQVHSIAVTISNLDSIADGDLCWIRVSRLCTDASDTMAGDAMLLGFKLEYTST